MEGPWLQPVILLSVCKQLLFVVLHACVGRLHGVPGAGGEDHICVHQSGPLGGPAGELQQQESEGNGCPEPHAALEGV